MRRRLAPPLDQDERRGRGRADVSSANGRPPGNAPADPARDRIAAAVIELVGNRGFAETSIEMVCEEAETRRSHFDRCFAGKEDCFLCIHDEVAAEFCDRVLAAYAGASSWHDRVWAAGWAAMRFFHEDAHRARFLVVEVNGSGNGAQSRRDRVLQRLADILDGGRDELEKPDSVSRCTAEIVAGAIYGTVLGRIEAGCIERGEDFLPELVYMAVMPYLGSRAAEDELLVQPLR
jgi:AcrR family transcriptional regulator